MTINKYKSQDKLIFELEGRLDTLTSSELELQLNENICGVKKLIFDFTNLEYLSSAGLRILLSAQKTMKIQGEMVIKNVNDTIKEIFKATGFDNILTLE